MPARDTDLDLLVKAAQDSAAIAMRYFKRQIQIWDKGSDLGPVTEADLAVNQHLKATLTEARPDYGWLSEETPDDTARLGKEKVFILDPIDGTRAFIAGEDNFAVSLAIAEAGIVTHGVVILPAKGRIYTARRGEPAYCNGEAIRPSARHELAHARILATKANMAPAFWPKGVPDLQRSFRTSLAYRLCLVAEGRYDGMLTFRPTWEWDIAAGSLIVEAAGGAVSDQRGLPLVFNRPEGKGPGVIAANAALHGALLDRL